jgi:hypothetical protein
VGPNVNDQVNPYRSPSEETFSTNPKLPFETEPEKERSELLRFILHIFIVSFFAPGCGGFIHNLFFFDWQNEMPEVGFVGKIVGSFFGSVFFLFYIWMITIPIGFASYFVCLGLNRCNAVNKRFWSICGGIIGGFFGWCIARYGSEAALSFVLCGAIIGIIFGWLIAVLWRNLKIKQV